MTDDERDQEARRRLAACMRACESMLNEHKDNQDQEDGGNDELRVREVLQMTIGWLCEVPKPVEEKDEADEECEAGAMRVLLRGVTEVNLRRR